VSRVREALVVGAGISGLWAALLLARRGVRVRVLERAAVPGGLAGAESFRGVPCDLGSHRLHPAALSRPLFRELHQDAPLARRPRRGVLLFGGRRVPYPPTAFAMMRALGPLASAEVALGMMARPDRREAFTRWQHGRAAGEVDVGFERFVRERVGEAAYRAFYAPYAEKVWGLPPAELSQSIAKKRVSTTAPWQLLQNAAGRVVRRLLGAQGEVDAGGFLYPVGGTASIVGWLVERLREHGVEIEHGQRFDVAAPRRGPTLFAGDLRDLGPTPLSHRGLYLVYLALALPHAGEVETYYAPEQRFWFGRVSEIQHYSPALRRAGETILTVEIPEGRLGSHERFDSSQRLEGLLAQLGQAGIVPPDARVLEARQRFVPGVYPLYRRGFRGPWREAVAGALARGVLPFGRQALFLHVNLDHCTDIAEDAVQHVLEGRPDAAWLARAEGYLDLQVRD
jgi:hypothetical protein